MEKGKKYLVVIPFVLLMLCFSCDRSAEQVGIAMDRPNIVFIMVDDLGKEWVSCYGADSISTPNVDLLAAQGTRFDNVYCMPQCTPTRLTFLTGQYPYGHGWVNHWDVPRWGGGAHYDERENPCLPLKISEAGYAACAAGKWQIDDFRVEPDALSRIGFDDWCMWTGYESRVPASAERYHDPYLYTKDGSKTYEGQFGPDIINQFVCDYIGDHKDEPFFVYYPMMLTHGPLVQPPGSNASSKIGLHKSMVSYTDMLLGKVMATLDENGLTENTLLIWTTDNGTARGITGHIDGVAVQGGKGNTSEPGINVPFVARWPKHLAANTHSQALIDFTDFFPTFLELMQGKDQLGVSAGHGSSFADVLKGETSESQRDWIMSMGGGNFASLTEAGVENQYVYRDRVLRDHRYKLYIDTQGEPAHLFDLQTDPHEQEDILGTQDADAERSIRVFQEAIDHMPNRDSDPRYQPNPAQAWDVDVTQESQVWKKTQ